MAHYYLTDAFSTWNVFDPNFPDELPKVGERVYVAIVDGPLNKDAEKAFTEVYTITYQGIDWLNNWYSTLKDDPKYGKDATIIWVAIPPIPALPSKWRICGLRVCEEHICEYHDNRYCMNNEKCQKGKIHKEFSRRDW